MDFLKSAVASAISKTSALPFSLEDRVDVDSSSIWSLHNGIRREDGSKCSIFTFDVSTNKSRLPLAQNALRKLRTLRHPSVIKSLDTIESDSHIYVITERLTPLAWHIRRKSLTPETIKWGLHSIAKAVKFINADASSVHGSIRSSSVFTTESGEWKLGGFEILSSMKDDDAIIYSYGGLVPDSGRGTPPEIVKAGWDAIKRQPIHALDSYGFGILVYESFNGAFLASDQLMQPKNVPLSMQSSYKRLISANPKARISAEQFLDIGLRSGGFFETPLIRLTEGIENLGLKSDTEREEFLSKLDEVSNDFPEDFFKMKILPELTKSVEFGGGGPRVFIVVLNIGSKLTGDEYERTLTPLIARLFASPDRAMRVCLLDNLPKMIDHLPQKMVNNSIFPQLVTGFSDVAPVVREQTVKAVLTLVTKLSDRIINGELLRHLAKTANDEQPGIRTNTTICLGKIARNLSPGTRGKVLTAAFARALRDPFVHARCAALMALAATVDMYAEEDCATKILPGICPSLIDKEKIVRDQANKTHDIYMQRVRKFAQTLPETLQPPTGTSSQNPTRSGTPQNESWAGWAISSFTNKISTASGEMQTKSTSTGASSIITSDRPSSVPPTTSSKHLILSSKNNHASIPKHTPQNPFASVPSDSQPSPPVEVELDTGWDDADAWGDQGSPANDEDDPFSFNSSESKRTATAIDFDDKGEPDFEGWLNAQAKAKKKKSLPKGLSKTSSTAATKPVLASKAQSASTLEKKSSTMAARPKKVAAKKLETKKAEEDDEWGAAWE